MKRFFLLTVLVFVGVMAWRIGGRMSPDALGVAVGLVFGVLASVPAALLVLAAARRGDQRPERGPSPRAGRRGMGGVHPYSGEGYPPVVVVTGGGYPSQPVPGASQGGYPALPGPGYPLEAPPPRQFHVVGEESDWLEE